MTNGEVRVYRDSAPDPATDAHPPGAARRAAPGYNPALGQDAAGRLWVAWYSNASGNIGIYLLQLDPATGGPLAGAQPTKVPQSESPANNGFHLALACAAGCRIVYGAQTAPTAPLRLASWAPGEGGPTNIGGGARLSLGLPLTAAYRADGRLWVAWYDLGTTKGFYAAKLGNAKGAGGTVQNLGRPAGGGFVDARNLDSVAVGHRPGARRHRRHQPAARVALDHLRPGPGDDHREPADHPERARDPDRPQAHLAEEPEAHEVREREGRRQRAGPRPGGDLLRPEEPPPVRPEDRRLHRARHASSRCVRVPFRAKTFDPRAPAGIRLAVRKGAASGRQGPPARVVTRDIRFF